MARVTAAIYGGFAGTIQVGAQSLTILCRFFLDLSPPLSETSPPSVWKIRILLFADNVVISWAIFGHGCTFFPQLSILGEVIK
jgi:hypothetical protein